MSLSQYVANDDPGCPNTGFISGTCGTLARCSGRSMRFLPLIVDVTMMVLLMLPYVYIAMDACCHCNGNAPGCVGKFQSTYCDMSYDCKMIDS